MTCNFTDDELLHNNFLRIFLTLQVIFQYIFKNQEQSYMQLATSAENSDCSIWKAHRTHDSLQQSMLFPNQN